MNICTGSEAIIKEIISYNITDSDNIALNITDSEQTLKGRI